MHRSNRLLLLAAAAGVLQAANAIDLDVNSTDSIRAAAATVAQGLHSYYQNNQTGPNVQAFEVGTYPFPPYYWWESGAAWGGLMDYQVYTGDTTYQNDTLNAMLAQVGAKYDYVVDVPAYGEANDDQAFWVFNLMTALEYNLPLLPCPNGTSNSDGSMCATHYLRMADNAFNDYVTRYLNDSSYCNGGLRWQYNPAQNGYTYKNSISNGGFFNIAARLARYTGNTTYSDWATRVFDWETGVGFITPDYHVYDGAGIDQNCTAFDKTEWTYNLGVFIYGAAAMADLAGAPWTQRVESFMETAASVFFSPYANATGVMFEPSCEQAAQCNTDQQSFKAFLARWLGKSAVLVPSIAANVTALMQASAQGAAASCSGLGNSTCGSKWYTGEWDGAAGLGQELMALETIQALLVGNAPSPAKMGGGGGG